MLTALALFISSVALSVFLTWWIRNLAVSRGWVSAPRSPRHIHKRPIPRLGGVAIFCAFVLSVGISVLVILLSGRALPFDPSKLTYIVPPVFIIFGLGLWDDIHPLNPSIKFGVQSVAALLLYLGGMRIGHIPMLFGAHQFGVFTGMAVTIFWVVGITNAFNLIDGMDGLAAGSALFSTLAVMLNSLISGDTLTFFMTAALAGCILGFLRFNFNPATIFLGDSGSLSIGFVLSALALAEARKSGTLVAVAIPVVALGLPITDTALAIARRLLSGKSLFSADREHIHHKLLQKGFSQRQAVLILYAVTAAFCLVSLFLRYRNQRIMGVVLAILAVIVLIGVQRLNYIEFFELRRVAQRTIEQREVIVNNLALRRTRQELTFSESFDEICSALERGFQNNDFQGFKLEITAALSVHPARILPMSMVEDVCIYCWNKQQSIEESESWKMSLDLVSTRGARLGFFSVVRPYCERPLMVDVNLLTSGFHLALADAIERAISNARFEPRAAVVLTEFDSEIASVRS